MSCSCPIDSIPDNDANLRMREELLFFVSSICPECHLASAAKQYIHFLVGSDVPGKSASEDTIIGRFSYRVTPCMVQMCTTLRIECWGMLGMLIRSTLLSQQKGVSF